MGTLFIKYFMQVKLKNMLNSNIDFLITVPKLLAILYKVVIFLLNLIKQIVKPIILHQHLKHLHLQICPLLLLLLLQLKLKLKQIHYLQHLPYQRRPQIRFKITQIQLLTQHFQTNSTTSLLINLKTRTAWSKYSDSTTVYQTF